LFFSSVGPTGINSRIFSPPLLLPITAVIKLLFAFLIPTATVEIPLNVQARDC